MPVIPALPRFALTRRSLIRGAVALSPAAAWPLAGCSSGAGNPAARNDRVLAAAQQMPALARQLLDSAGVPGLSWAVVHGGATVAAGGAGLRRVGDAGPVDADTVFQLASISKPLGATVVAREVGAGRVSWDSRMRDLLPWFALSDADSTERLTVGDLYAHRSGLPDHAGDKLEELGYSQREVLQRLRLLPVSPLRTQYAYTNAGLTAAAVGVARAAGLEWAELSRRNLYAPLGMARTTSVHAEFMRQSNRATGHVPAEGGGWQPGPGLNPDAQSAAGGASSSARDMARWMALLLAQGRWQGEVLVEPAALAPMWRLQAPQSVGYGYGFNVGATDTGLQMLSHSGAFLLGAATCFMMVPALDAAVIVLCNAAPIGVPETLSRQFVDLVEHGRLTQDWWPRYRDAIAPLLRPGGDLAGQPAPAHPEPAGPLARYAGRYRNAYYGELEVAPAGQGLELRLGPLPQRHPLQHWSGAQFVFFPVNESAPPGTVSLARFAPAAGAGDAAGSVYLEYYNKEDQGMFTRVA